MLVLTRKVGQKTMIELEDGRILTVTINSTSGNKVQLGIEAPSTVLIAREEILEALQAKKQTI